MSSQLIFFILVEADLISDLHESTLGGLQPECVLLVNLYLMLQCRLNDRQLPLDNLVDPHQLAVVRA